jgi:hypothetical protein
MQLRENVFSAIEVNTSQNHGSLVLVAMSADFMFSIAWPWEASGLLICRRKLFASNLSLSTSSRSHTDARWNKTLFVTIKGIACAAVCMLSACAMLGVFTQAA